jgi:glycosyltransferase involved in cell wall biosynthesis
VLLVYEPVCYGLEHVPFNTGILEAGLAAFNGRVTFAAEASHIAAVCESAPPAVRDAVEWRKIDIAPRRLTGFRARLPYERKLLDEIWKITAAESPAAILSTVLTEPGLLALKWKVWSSGGNTPVGAVFHSALEGFRYSRKRRFYLRAATPPRLRYLLLGETIRTEVLKLVPQIADHAFVLPHPLTPGVDSGPAELSHERIGFAFLGRATPEKGFPLFLEVARESILAPQPGGTEFALIGSYFEEFRREIQSLLQSAPGRFHAPPDADRKVPTEEYRQRMHEADYVVMPYSADAYRFTCSGAVFDALAAAKPLIALRTPLFEELFARMGDIGYLCATPGELARTVHQIAAGPPRGRYREQVTNLLREREFFETPSVARHLAAALQPRKP